MSYLDAIIEGCLDDLRNPSGSRNTELFRQGARLYTVALAGVVDEAHITAILEREARAIGLTRAEIRDTLRSAQRTAQRASVDQLAEIREKCAGRHVLGGTTEPVYHPPEVVQPPSPSWQGRIRDFVRYAQGKLATDAVFKDGLPPLAYLHARGFDQTTIQDAGLGYNPRPLFLPRQQVGLEPEQDERGRWITTIKLPHGIVIPWEGRGHLWRVSVRTPGEGAGKYQNLRGGSNALYHVDAIRSGNPVMIVEGVFDALAVHQAAGDLIAPVACGTTGARRLTWIGQIARASQVLVSFDRDAAGQDATRFWLSAFGSVAHAWSPLLKDAAEMLQAGMNLRIWVEEGIGAQPTTTLTLEILTDGTARLVDEQGTVLGVFDSEAAAEAAALTWQGGRDGN